MEPSSPFAFLDKRRFWFAAVASIAALIVVQWVVARWINAEYAKAAGLFSALFLMMAFGVEYPSKESLSWRRRLFGAFVGASVFAILMTLLDRGPLSHLR